MQAIILAAGMGKRLKELTSSATKCMVKVNGRTMIERALASLDKLGLSRVVLVTGYEAARLKEYIGSLQVKTPLVYVHNPIFDKTNNIYSLYLAKEYLQQEDTLLMESDIVFEDALLFRLLENPYPSLALVARHERWMDGTVVTLDDEDNILRFLSKKDFDFREKGEYFKTVNIYKFSREFSKSHYVPFLEAYCKALGHNAYYEQVLKVITLLDKPEIKAVRLNGEKWYEIDDIQDLDIAESLFSEGKERLERFQKRFGGYWRYEGLLDYCYLVNPYYPCKRLKDELRAEFDELLCQYPSGMGVNSLLAAKYFGVRASHICVGNGAAELIKSLMELLPEKLGVIYPTFEEYPNRKRAEDILAFTPDNDDFAYDADDLMAFYEDKPIAALLLINPDNPSGNYLPKEQLGKLAAWAEEKGIRLVLDESFADFAEEPACMLTEKMLVRYPHLLIVKSISKSYGVPGLRLGVLAGADEALIAAVKRDVSIWNINSFAEYYLQIFEKYREDYTASLARMRESRRLLMEGLGAVGGIRPIPSQANYILCQLHGGITSTALAERLLNEYQILIKDCAGKAAFAGRQYVRLAVRDEADNQRLLTALDAVLNPL